MSRKLNYVDMREECLISYKEIGAVFGMTPGAFQALCDRAGVKLPKWGTMTPDAGSKSPVYVPIKYLSLLLLRIYRTSNKYGAEKRFNMMHNAQTFCRSKGIELYGVVSTRTHDQKKQTKEMSTHHNRWHE